ncbi:hypothetical protein ACFOU2_04640 [Bacillus songklensis]|uniref:Uncharacterized protein n=1 Tax=Bacillus songklensis TaxID=1069116 RepID=A0ABV8AYU8_9BACI
MCDKAIVELIQTSNYIGGNEPVEVHKGRAIEKHIMLIREVRDTWQFYRDRRPETYEEMTALLP